MTNVTVLSQTQRIVMNSATSSISVINAGPMGPSGVAGSDAHIVDLIGTTLKPGSGIALDTTTPGEVGIINTGAVSSYTDENARNAIGNALVGVPEHILITPDDLGNTISVDIDPLFVGRMLLLEQSKSLIQYKDNTAAAGTAYMNLTGSAGYVSTPNNAAFNVASDICVLVRFKMPSTVPAANFHLIGRVGSSTALTQWRLSITTAGQVSLTISVNGTSTNTVVTTAATPLAFNGNWIWLRMVRKSSDGTVDYSTAADDGTNNVPTTWTTFQLNRASSVGALWNNGGTLSVPMSIGAYNSGAGLPFTGQIGRALVYSGTSTAGTLLADANASDWTTGTTWTGPAGRVWTLNGTASVVAGGTSSISNTAAEFTLTDTDAYPSIPVKRGDTLFWTAVGTFINTSGVAKNFTPKLQINGVDLFTFPAISIPSTAAGQTYRWECATRIEINDPAGTKQIAQAGFKVFSATTGTDLGSSVMSAPITGGSLGGVRAEAISTFTSVPVIRLRNTMETAAATIASRPILTQLFLSAA